MLTTKGALAIILNKREKKSTFKKGKSVSKKPKQLSFEGRKFSFFSIFSIIRPTGSQVSKMFPVPNVWEGIRPKVKKFILLIYGKSSLVSVRTRSLFSFTRFLLKMHKHHGSDFTIKWLKACFVSLQRYCGDNRVQSLREIQDNLPFPRMINGLPAIIFKGDRRKIQNAHKPTIQF